MDQNIFGSVLDLGTLLGEGGLDGLENETLLEDLGQPLSGLDCPELPQDFPQKAASNASSYSGLSYDASHEESDTFSAPLQIPPGYLNSEAWFASNPPNMPASTTVPGPFKQSHLGVPQSNSAALLSQLLTAIQTSTAQKQDDIKQETVVPASAPKPAENLSLPSLTAQQQRALSSIMSLGSLGTTPEGKKVKRMLSNRESARRSRHRKQAHVHDLEEKVLAVEAENKTLKANLSKATEQEMHHMTERLQMQAEIASLRSKIAYMEHGGLCSGPRTTPPGSHASNGGASVSFDSCCASKPHHSRLPEIEHEHCSKKRKS